MNSDSNIQYCTFGYAEIFLHWHMEILLFVVKVIFPLWDKRLNCNLQAFSFFKLYFITSYNILQLFLKILK